jgi:hypothetical protein
MLSENIYTNLIAVQLLIYNIIIKSTSPLLNLWVYFSFAILRAHRARKMAILGNNTNLPTSPSRHCDMNSVKVL